MIEIKKNLLFWVKALPKKERETLHSFMCGLLRNTLIIQHESITMIIVLINLSIIIQIIVDTLQ